MTTKPKSKAGGVRANSGRKPKDEERRIRDLTSPYVDGAINCVVAIMTKGEKESDRLSAAKLILEYHFGKPTQKIAGEGGVGMAMIFKPAAYNE